MKKITLFFTVLLSLLTSQAQVIFSEDFDGIQGATAGGAGSYSFPTGWLLRNVDNKTPDAQVSYVNEAWERREDFSFNVQDSCAFSTSYYSPFGSADDWMWTPLITLPSNCKLKWKAVAYDPLYLDGYEVRIMTQSSTPGGPTGGTGVMGNQLTNSTLLFNVAAENSAWTDREIDLSVYSGQSVWIAFRNNSNDKFLLLIDDVVVEQVINYDAAISNFQSPEYTQIPLSQVSASPVDFTSTITNIGSLALTGVTMNINITDASNALVYSSTSSPQTLAPGSNASFAVAGFTPTYASTYTIKAFSTSSEVDQQNLNDTLSWNIIITDSIFARDNGTGTGSLGIGAGTGGYIGQAFTINEADTLTSITIAFNQGYIGENFAAVVWNTQNGVPSTIIGGTDTLLYTNTAFQVNTIPIQGLVILQPGEYVVTAIEFDSTLALVNTNEIFTVGTVWVNWPTIASGTWANVEAFGSSFAKSFVLRPNFGSLCNTVNYQQSLTICEGENIAVGSSVYTQSGIYIDTLQNGFCDSIVETQLTVIPAVIPQVNYQPLDQLSTPFISGASYQWIDCNSNQPIAGEIDTLYIAPMNGLYAVEVNNSGCIDTSECVEVIFWGLEELNADLITVSPNPVIDEVMITSSQTGLIQLINPVGQHVLTINVKENETIKLSLKGMATGVYFIQLEGYSIVQRIVLN